MWAELNRLLLSLELRSWPLADAVHSSDGRSLLALLPSLQKVLPTIPDSSVDPLPPPCSAEFAPDLLKMAFDQLFEVIKPREQEMVQALLVALQKQQVLPKPDMLQQGLSEHTQQLEDLRWVVNTSLCPPVS